MIEHHIQKDILDRLSTAQSLRFSELKPENLESNSFMYHLRQLMAAHLVAQQADKAYHLTPQGLGYIDTLTLTTGRPRKQPKLISILALRNPAGEYMFAKRLRQPAIGTWMIPSGKRHFGESPDEHGMREANELLGKAMDLRWRGLLDMRLRSGGEVVSHLVARVYEGSYDGPVPADTQKFHYGWHRPDADILLTPGTRELLDALQGDDKLFSLSLDADTD